MRIFIFLCLGFLFASAASASEVPSGVPMTPDWVAYNKTAEQEKRPTLDYFVTCENVVAFNAVGIKEIFSKSDEAVFVFTKWSNAVGGDVYRVEVYNERGAMIYIWQSVYSYNTSKWELKSRIYVRDTAIRDMPGRYNVKIYMNDKHVTTQYFTIDHEGGANKIEKYNKTVCFTPFFIKFGSAEGISLPTYIAQKFILDHPNIKVILPEAFYRQTGMQKPSDDVELDSFLPQFFNSQNILDYTNKNKIDYYIVGLGINANAEYHNVYFYIYDTRNGQLFSRIFKKANCSNYINCYPYLYKELIRQADHLFQ